MIEDIHDRQSAGDIDCVDVKAGGGRGAWSRKTLICYLIIIANTLAIIMF